MPRLLRRREPELHMTRRVRVNIVAYPQPDFSGVEVKVLDKGVVDAVSDARLESAKRLLREGIPSTPIVSVPAPEISGLTEVQAALRMGFSVVVTFEVVGMFREPTGYRWDLPDTDPGILSAIKSLEAEWRTYLPDYVNDRETPDAAGKIDDIRADLQIQYGLLLFRPIAQIYIAKLKELHERQLRIAGSEAAIRKLRQLGPEPGS